MPPRRIMTPKRKVAVQRRGMPGQAPKLSQRGRLEVERGLAQRRMLQQMKAARAGAKNMGGLHVQRQRQQSKSWFGVWGIGPIIEWVLNFAYRGRRHEGHERRKLREGFLAPGAKARGAREIAQQQRKYGYEPTRRRKTG